LGLSVLQFPMMISQLHWSFGCDKYISMGKRGIED